MERFSKEVEMCIGKLATNLEKFEKIECELQYSGVEPSKISELKECVDQETKLIEKLFKEITGYNLDFQHDEKCVAVISFEKRLRY